MKLLNNFKEKYQLLNSVPKYNIQCLKDLVKYNDQLICPREQR